MTRLNLLLATLFLTVSMQAVATCTYSSNSCSNSTLKCVQENYNQAADFHNSYNVKYNKVGKPITDFNKRFVFGMTKTARDYPQVGREGKKMLTKNLPKLKMLRDHLQFEQSRLKQKNWYGGIFRDVTAYSQKSNSSCNAAQEKWLVGILTTTLKMEENNAKRLESLNKMIILNNGVLNNIDNLIAESEKFHEKTGSKPVKKHVKKPLDFCLQKYYKLNSNGNKTILSAIYDDDFCGPLVKSMNHNVFIREATKFVQNKSNKKYSFQQKESDLNSIDIAIFTNRTDGKKETIYSNQKSKRTATVEA